MGVWGEPGPDREVSPTSQAGAPVPCVSLPGISGCLGLDSRNFRPVEPRGSWGSSLP